MISTCATTYYRNISTPSFLSGWTYPPRYSKPKDCCENINIVSKVRDTLRKEAYTSPTLYCVFFLVKNSSRSYFTRSKKRRETTINRGIRSKKFKNIFLEPRIISIFFFDNYKQWRPMIHRHRAKQSWSGQTLLTVSGRFLNEPAIACRRTHSHKIKERCSPTW